MDRPADRTSLRTTFDSAAERYDRARPPYPIAIFDDLAASAKLERGSRVLELGAGTGLATVPSQSEGATSSPSSSVSISLPSQHDGLPPSRERRS